MLHACILIEYTFLSMAMKIYTKVGDGGKTSLIGGTKVPKNHIRIESYGSVDELNCHLGLCADQLPFEDIKLTIKEIQDRLFTIGSSLACDPDKEPLMKMPDLLETDIEFLEQEIDRMNESLPPMKFFIIPGGHVAVSSIHVARCVCRRTERACVALQQHELFVDPLVIRYLNRLSDYIFVLGRYAGKLLDVPEQPWRPRVR